MDFNDILSYPSPNDTTRAQIQSTDLHACERMLNVCASLVNVLSDREIDIKSVHYKYRLERFLRSRSRTSQRFIKTYERRFPELAIPSDQVFIYESNGNVKIDQSFKTKNKIEPPQCKISTISSVKTQCVEDRKVSRAMEQKVFNEFIQKNKKPKVPRRPKNLPCLTVAIYHPRVSLLDAFCVKAPIPLPWIVKKIKYDPVICDLRHLFSERNQIPFECDLRPLFRVPVSVESFNVVSPLLVGTISELSPQGSDVDDYWVETPVRDLLFAICIVVQLRAIVIVFALVGILLFLMCYASLGENIYRSINWLPWISNDDDHKH